MARGNIIQGQASGKLGDSVLMVRNGQQVSRVYTKSGARSGNQASEAARIQRVKFGSASNQWGLYRYVCTRMFRKGRKATQSDYNYFVKRNQSLFPYLSKQENADGVHCLMPGQFSEGTLGRIELVHIVRPTVEAGQNVVYVSDLNAAGTIHVKWSGNVGALKEGLRLMYPNSRKFTYLISVPTAIQIDEEGVTVTSQSVSHHTIIFDLYAEIRPNENSETVAAYFARYIGDTKLKAAINAQGELQMAWASSPFRLSNAEGVDVNYISNIGVLVFATDDNAADCYSTLVQDTSIPATFGAYAVWAGYRSQNSLRVAADSYGYQSGVMRDEIASITDDLNEQVSQYLNKVKAIDETAAKEIAAFVKSKAKTVVTVRKEVDKNEDK